jgi:nucleoside-diphosphate-sugar epimerase
MVAPKHNGQKVLVTGATGYIGAQLVGQLLQKGYHVRAGVRNQKKADALAARYYFILFIFFHPVVHSAYVGFPISKIAWNLFL